MSDAATSSRLTPDRVLSGAVALADEIGLETFTIRRLAAALDTKPMTIYHHLANKEAIVDGMVDRVFAEIDLPSLGIPWRDAMRRRCRSARAVLARHPWASPVMESRLNPGPATLGHHNAMVQCFREAGFSWGLTAHAYAVLDSFVYGFALQEANLPATEGAEMHELVEAMSVALEPYPFLADFTVNHVMRPDYDFGAEFDAGLDLLLDGLEAKLTAESR